MGGHRTEVQAKETAVQRPEGRVHVDRCWEMRLEVSRSQLMPPKSVSIAQNFCPRTLLPLAS